MLAGEESILTTLTVCVFNQKVRDHLGEPAVDWGIISKRVISEQDMRMWLSSYERWGIFDCAPTRFSREDTVGLPSVLHKDLAAASKTKKSQQNYTHLHNENITNTRQNIYFYCKIKFDWSTKQNQEKVIPSDSAPVIKTKTFLAKASTFT